MSMTITNANGAIRVNLPENFAVEEVAKFRNEVYGLMAKGAKRFIIDFRGCAFIDSTGLGILVSIYKKCAEMRGNMKLCAINPKVLHIFQLTRLDRVFDIYTSYEEASKAS